MLSDRKWKLKYTPDDGDLVRLFYVPALEDAERYDRLTGYFSASALSLAARGIEGLVRNDGHMRLVVGCTLEARETEAIEKGEALRDLVERRLAEIPLAPPDSASSDALELLAWMVARGHMDVKVAVPCDTAGKPIPTEGIFHEKSGIIEDRGGNKIAWNGSLNETAAGWQHNWESINVYTNWGADHLRVTQEESNFARIWANTATRVIVLDVPGAVQKDLMRFMPKGDQPARLKKHDRNCAKPLPKPEAKRPPKPTDPGLDDLRSRVWSFVQQAPSIQPGGERVGEETSAIEPWPHQVRAFERMYHNWPPRLLIADEVGLGKTIQAGMLLRQAYISGRAKRILILAPKAILNQWQVELREKFNLNWPIYDGSKLIWYPSPALRGRNERHVAPDRWHHESVVIASSHLMRRRDRATELLVAEPWDLIVLDEAHHARRRAAGTPQQGGPNALLRLMVDLKDRTQGLILLTATPMQVHPIEVWDLLNLLGLPAAWSATAFLGFFDDADEANPSPEAMERMANLFQAVEKVYGEGNTEEMQRLVDLSGLRFKKVIRALRSNASIPRRRLETAERTAAVRVVRANTPLRRLVSRHTRELLRRYFNTEQSDTPVAVRRVEDRFLEMKTEERAIYEAVEDYIATTYNQASARERTSVGFVMTIYRRRLASSFNALRATLQRHLDSIGADNADVLFGVEEDVPDDESVDELLDVEQVEKLEREALAAAEESDIQGLLESISQLPPDSKLDSLKSALSELRKEGYSSVMVFTQYTDTMDFLREALRKDGEFTLMCYSGRGAEMLSADGSWKGLIRDEAKQKFRDGEAEILLCTDAAAEGLNFQFCGAVINYDMPWNPMRVEQRIGRIDRLGQEHGTIRIINLHYDGTVETDVYRALRSRIGLFESVVGRLQPILAQLPRTITRTVLSGEERDEMRRANVVDEIQQQAQETEGRGFDIDDVTDEELTMPARATSPVSMADLDRVITSPDVMPQGTDIQHLGSREYGLLAPGMNERLRVTTDPGYFEENSESVELWSPGNPLFQSPEFTTGQDKPPAEKTLKEILDG